MKGTGLPKAKPETKAHKKLREKVIKRLLGPMPFNPITQEPWEEEFDDLFVSTNAGSATGLWWKIPSKVGVEEKADPKAVKAFISKWLQQERVKGFREGLELVDKMIDEKLAHSESK